MHIKNLLILCLFFVPFFCFPQQFDFNEPCQSAYGEITGLKLSTGKKLLKEETLRHPQNLIPVYLENYIDFLNIFFTGDAQAFEVLGSTKNTRLSKLKKGDSNSPYYLYTQAEIYLQYSLLKIRFREYISGILEMRRAYKLFEENIQAFPDFKPNQKSFGMIKAFFGITPSRYNWGLKLLGVEGNLTEGIHELEQLLASTDDHFLFRNEVINIYASLLLHLKGKGEEAWQVLQENNYPVKGDLFSYYNTVKIALYSRHNEEALHILKEIPDSEDYVTVPILDYYHGVALLNKLDNSCRQYFKIFLNNNTGKDHVKSSYQKLAWSYLLEGNDSQYKYFINQIPEHGSAELDADKQAQKEADNNQSPNVILLNARLLFDGGYYMRAAEVLQNVAPEDFSQIEHQLELVYRKGRIYDESGDEQLAIENYLKTIERGKNASLYYAANAALNLAFIYESKGNLEKAWFYFNECLIMDDHEYAGSLEQKAKAGLERIQ